MAGGTTPSHNSLIRNGLAFVTCALVVCLNASAQPQLSLLEASARDASDHFKPLHSGQRVILRGVVNAPSFHFPDYSVLAFEDADHGMIQLSGVVASADKAREAQSIALNTTGVVGVKNNLSWR